MSTIVRESTIKRKIQLPFVIVDSFVSLKMSTIARESTITREIHAKVDNGSTERFQITRDSTITRYTFTRGDRL